MSKPIEGYITLQQAAALLGVSRQTITRRALSAELSTDSSLDSPGRPLDSLGQSMDSKPASIVQDKKRYVSMAWVLAEQEAAAAANYPTDSLGQPLDSLDSPGQSMDTFGQPLDSLGQSMDSKPDTLDSSLDSLDSPRTPLDSKFESLDSPRTAADTLAGRQDSAGPSLPDTQRRILDLEKDLLAAQGEAAALRATVEAQEAHIDSLKTALDREQSLHMASLQQRLPAGRGSGFMEWVKGWGKKQNDR